MDEPTDQGKMFAVVAYAGFFFGLPTGLLPLLMRDDDFALYHGRHATAVWLVHFVLVMFLTAVISFISAVTCGLGSLLFPILLLPPLLGAGTSLHGVMLSMNGERAEPIGGLGLGELLFSGITVKEKVAAPAPPALPGPTAEAGEE